jgi:hypothetical protein
MARQGSPAPLSELPELRNFMAMTAPGHTAVPLRFRFRGRRDYVQSADIAAGLIDLVDGEAVAEWCGLQYLSRLQMNGLIGHHCLAVAHGDMENRPAAVAEFVRPRDAHSETVRIAVIQTTEPVSKRVPYDESPLEDALHIDANENVAGGFRASTVAVAGYGALDQVVYAQKMLSHAIVGHMETKWLAAQFTFKGRLPAEYSLIELEPGRVVGDRFVSSVFAFDGQDFGEAVFIASSGRST